MKALLKHPHPTSELEVIRAANEQMNVVRHKDISPNGDAVLIVGALGEEDESLVDVLRRKKRPSMIRACGYEEHRVIWENRPEARRNFGERVHRG